MNSFIAGAVVLVSFYVAFFNCGLFERFPELVGINAKQGTPNPNGGGVAGAFL